MPLQSGENVRRDVTQRLLRYVGSGMRYDRAVRRVQREYIAEYGAGNKVHGSTMNAAVADVKAQRFLAGIHKRADTRDRKRAEQQARNTASLRGVPFPEPDTEIQYRTRGDTSQGVPFRRYDVEYRHPQTDRIVSRTIYIPIVGQDTDRLVVWALVTAIMQDEQEKTTEQYNELFRAVSGGRYDRIF